MNINRRALAIFWSPLIGLWVFLLVIITQIEIEEFTRLAPYFLYIIVSGLLVWQLQQEVLNSQNDSIVIVARAKLLINCLVVATISILFDFLFFKEQLNLFPSMLVLGSLVASFFYSGILAYSNDQLEQGYSKRVKERNKSLDTREEWSIYLKELNKKFRDSDEITYEVSRIMNIVQYSSYFRLESAIANLSKLKNTDSIDEIILLLKEVE